MHNDESAIYTTQNKIGINVVLATDYDSSPSSSNAADATVANTPW